MAACCDPQGYDEFFSNRFARRMGKKYRRRGLNRTATRLVDFLAADGLEGRTVLEIGGGVGEIGVELVRRGAGSVTTLELSSAYDEEAGRVAAEAGVADRMHRRVLDIVASPEEVEPADLVVLHRVVCCYPDYAALLGAAADHCRGRLAFSYPPRNRFTRVLLAVDNTGRRVLGRDFRAFVHPPDAMLAVLVSRGLRPVLERGGWIWQVQGLAR